MADDPARMMRAAVLAKLRAECPELLPDDIEVRIYSRSRKQVIALVVIPKEGTRAAPIGHQAEPFVPSAYQEDILGALEGKALRTDALANLIGGDRRRLYKPNGLKELQAEGWVAWHSKLGFYRPDAPPPELGAEE